MARGSMSLRERLTIVFAMLVFLAGFAVVGMVVAPSAFDTPDGTPQLPLMLLGVAGVAIVAVLGGRALATAVLRPLSRVVSDTVRVGVALRSAGSVGWREAINDPAEVQAIYASIKRLVDDVQSANEQREVVVAAIGHDLRTSLLSIRNVLDQLPSQRSDDRDSVVLAVREEAMRALRLTEQMTAVFAVERNSEITLESQSIRVIVDEVVNRVVLGSPRSGVRAEIVGDLVAPVDRALVERGIENLVTNAYRVARSLVCVTLLPGLIRVEDDGSGLPTGFEDQLRHGAGRSVRSQVDPYRVGLGVYIARTSAERHGGRLVVERSTLSGTVFLWYYG